ncbi:MAG: EAL domain-containing protein [Coleofasciculaceae cyanobacterium]
MNRSKGNSTKLTQELEKLKAKLRQSEQRYRAIVEDNKEPICRFLSDGRLTFVNSSFCHHFGKTSDELVGQNFLSLMPEEHRHKLQRHIDQLSSQNPVATRESQIVLPSGEVYWQQWTDRLIIHEQNHPLTEAKSDSLTSFEKEGLEAIVYSEEVAQIVEFQSVGRNITERRQTEQETSRLASFPLLNPNPVVEMDLTGQVRYLNPEAMQLLPELPSQSVEHPFLKGVLSMLTLMQREGSLRREVKIGEVYYEQVLHYLEEINCLRIYAFDITERKKAEEQLIYNAFYDQLTKLANRALFMDRLGQAVRRVGQCPRDKLSCQPDLFAVLFLDLNRFKLVNDSLGNEIGDQLLQHFARRLQTCLRPTDTLARLGGDEFAILLENIQVLDDVTGVAEAIHQTLTKPFHLENSEVFMTLSIGIALSTALEGKPDKVVPLESTSKQKEKATAKWLAQSNALVPVFQPEDLLRKARMAMYQAKAQGNSRYEVYDTAMDSRALDRLQMETDLRRAIERQEFQVYYQPIVSLQTGKIAGFEALLRWRHPQRGLVSPMEFIPTAEETGLITLIDWWTLEEACRQMRIWQEEFKFDQPLTINVNLSSKQFTQTDLLYQIDTILRRARLTPSSLKLEITETVVMDNPDLVKALLLQLKERKISLCIDDFGTGYSSLSRLHNFPVNTLKVDRSFVSRIGASGENSEIIQAIVTIAKTLNMEVVAEGIETSEQILPLLALQCEYGQGYFFSKPIDGKAAREILKGQLLSQGRGIQQLAAN